MDPLLRFAVPDRHQAPLLGIAYFDATLCNSLLDVFEREVTDHSGTVDRMVAASLPEREADRLFEAGVSLVLAMWRVEQSPKSVASAAAESLASVDDLSGHQRATLRKRLGDLLRARELCEFAGAVRLTMESDRLYDDAHIISDIRPIFQGAVGKGATAAVIVHALRINAFNRMTNELETVEIGMTAGDLSDLKKALGRAEKKDTEMQRMLDQLDLRRIDAGRVL